MLAFAAPISPVSGTAADISIVAAGARKVLNRCGATGALLAKRPDSAWRPAKDAMSRHRALRSDLGEPFAEQPTMIAIFGSGGHLETTTFSVVVTRNKDGIWTGTVVGESKIWIADAPSNPLPRKEWTLPTNDGRRLDLIIGGKCLFAEPSGFEQAGERPPPLGVRYFTLDVLTSTQRHHAVFLAGEEMGQTAEITRLVLPR